MVHCFRQPPFVSVLDHLTFGAKAISRWSELSVWKLIAIEGFCYGGAHSFTPLATPSGSRKFVEGEVYVFVRLYGSGILACYEMEDMLMSLTTDDRWLVLIMYMTGLSIGVHLLNLLCLPAIVLVCYYH